MITSLLDVDLRKLIEAIERSANVELPRKLISASLNEGVLHIRFERPKGVEADVEVLPLRTPIYIFRDEAGNLTSMEVLDVERAMAELGQLNGTMG